ncbi:hypothetical protein [Paraburkholderia dilworthii]|uniref:hypothetical protein n=1 Tax=Paraburkholderia dilworthii TaxID=948106 RepID=UPI0012680E4F|nr:hypothetical protein [Paraburkholderia dilworthii]
MAFVLLLPAFTLLGSGWAAAHATFAALGSNASEKPGSVGRSDDFALLCATGKPFSGNCGCRKQAIVADNSSHCPVIFTAGRDRSGGVMDLAMAMGVTLFGMFTASTVYFFYKLER